MYSHCNYTFYIISFNVNSVICLFVYLSISPWHISYFDSNSDYLFSNSYSTNTSIPVQDTQREREREICFKVLKMSDYRYVWFHMLVGLQ